MGISLNREGIPNLHIYNLSGIGIATIPDILIEGIYLEKNEQLFQLHMHSVQQSTHSSSTNPCKFII